MSPTALVVGAHRRADVVVPMESKNLRASDTNVTRASTRRTRPTVSDCARPHSTSAWLREHGAEFPAFTPSD
jgi:hypothetical protein